MSYPQFGYTYPSAASSSLTTSQLLVPGTSLATSIPTTCCETGRAITSEPPTAGQTMYSTSALLSYPRVAGLPDAMYSSAYATQGYVPFGADPSAFYSPLGAENTEAWRSLSQSAGWPYDPTNMAGYPYGTSYGGLDVRRKNATRESTSTLKAWLYEHIKNPYPTKGEKIMLAIITKMTLTQVSTWFANARRRLKKENKMQWSPRNRTGDDDKGSDDEDEDCEGENKDRETNNNDDDNKDNGDRIRRDEDEDIVVDGGNDNDSLLSASDLSRDGPSKVLEDIEHKKDNSFDLKSHLSSPLDSPGSVTDSLLSPHLQKSHTLASRTSPGLGACASLSSNTDSNASGPGGVSASVGKVGQVNHLSEKPRIWSLADVATSSTPPMGRKSPLCLSSHSGTKMGTHTAFSSPTNPGFQPWMNGTYTSPSSHAGLSYNYPGLSHPLGGGNSTGQMSGNSLAMAGPAAHRNGLASSAMGGVGSLATPSAGYSKLPNGFLGEKNDIPQLSSSFNTTTTGEAHTAFKPVLKRV